MGCYHGQAIGDCIACDLIDSNELITRDSKCVIDVVALYERLATLERELAEASARLNVRDDIANKYPDEALVHACRHCGKALLPKNRRIADGCPCNSGRGINHGLVAKNTCTCIVCDPDATGSTRAPFDRVDQLSRQHDAVVRELNAEREARKAAEGERDEHRRMHATNLEVISNAARDLASMMTLFKAANSVCLTFEWDMTYRGAPSFAPGSDDFVRSALVQAVTKADGGGGELIASELGKEQAAHEATKTELKRIHALFIEENDDHSLSVDLLEADRVMHEALIAALPKCGDCGAPATKYCGCFVERICDACQPRQGRDYEDTREAAPLRAILKVMEEGK